MKRYLAPPVERDEEIQRVLIEERVGIFREEYDVYAQTGDQTVDLGLKDMTVSRRSNGTPPVELVPEGDEIEIRNNANANAVTVTTGLGETTLEQGEAETVTQSCTLSVGHNTDLQVTVERDTGDHLSEDELEEMGMEQEGAVVEGVSASSYVQSLADNLRKARHESANECLKYARELDTFLGEHAVDDPDYADVQETVDRMTTQLETKVSSGTLRGSGLDDEWHDRIDQVTHRVESLYARNHSG